MGAFWWFRIGGTVIVHIWWQVLGMMIYTAGVVAIHNYTDVKLGFGHTLIPVIGAVVSLLMGFRTNSAYARYWDGRTIWAQMTKNLRQIVITTWVSVQGTTPKDIVEKKSAINLCMAFAVATKHYLRHEFSYNNEDVKDLLVHLKKYYNFESNLHQDPATKPPNAKFKNQNKNVKGSKNSVKEEEILLEVPPELDSKTKKRNHYKDKVKTEKMLMAYDFPTPTNIPLEILCYLFSYATYVAKNKLGETFCINSIANCTFALLENLTNFERVRRTPIPLAYSVHLHHCVWLYLLAVPFQFVGTHSWGTVAIVALGSFCMLGILSIAYEIEDPFGYDDNDLPLDDYCHVLKREIELITGQNQPKPEDWIHSKNNKPFKYSANLDVTAEEILAKNEDEIKSILENNAKINFVIEHMKRKRNWGL